MQSDLCRKSFRCLSSARTPITSRLIDRAPYHNYEAFLITFCGNVMLSLIWPSEVPDVGVVVVAPVVAWLSHWFIHSLFKISCSSINLQLRAQKVLQLLLFFLLLLLLHSYQPDCCCGCCCSCAASSVCCVLFLSWAATAPSSIRGIAAMEFAWVRFACQFWLLHCCLIDRLIDCLLDWGLALSCLVPYPEQVFGCCDVKSSSWLPSAFFTY